jgi:predicted site-specific integrase-resolvase
MQKILVFRIRLCGMMLTASGAVMQKRAAIYVRVSTDKQTIENQVTALCQIAERRGWEDRETVFRRTGGDF